MRILLSTLLASSLAWSLTLDEAISRAKIYSPELKKAQVEVKRSNALESVAYSNYLPTLNATYSYKYRDKKTLFSRRNSYQYGLVSNYNLFNGLADYFNVSNAKEQIKISRLQEKATKEDLILAVKSSYIELLKFTKEITVRKEALKLLNKQYKDINNRYELGMSAKNELLQVDVSLQNTKHDLLKAQSKQIKKRANLNKLLNGNLKIDEKIEDISNLNLPTFSFKNLEKKMLNQRSELAVLSAQTNQLKAQSKIIRASYLPKVNLTVNHTIYDQSEKLGTAIAQPKDETTAVVNATWNLFEGGKTKAEQNVKIEELSAKNFDIESLIQNLRFQLREAYEDYLLAKDSQKIASHSLSSAKENYRIIADLNKEGNVKAVTLLDARLDLTQSQLLVNNAMLDLYMSYAKLERIVETKID